MKTLDTHIASKVKMEKNKKQKTKPQNETEQKEPQTSAVPKNRRKPFPLLPWEDSILQEDVVPTPGSCQCRRCPLDQWQCHPRP